MQELYCHACGMYVRFNAPEVDGRLIVNCPNCDHEHYRVVTNGIITGERWGSNNNSPIFYSTGATSHTVSYTATYTSTATIATGSSFLGDSWANTGSYTGS